MLFRYAKTKSLKFQIVSYAFQILDDFDKYWIYLPSH